MSSAGLVGLFVGHMVFGGVEEMSMRGAVTINVKAVKNHGTIKVSHRLRPAMKGFIQSQLPMEKGHL